MTLFWLSKKKNSGGTTFLASSSYFSCLIQKILSSVCAFTSGHAYWSSTCALSGMTGRSFLRGPRALTDCSLRLTRTTAFRISFRVGPYLAVQAALEEWKEAQRERGLDPDTILKLIQTSGPSAGSDTAKAMEEHFTSHLQLPSKEEMEQMLIERRKQVRLIFSPHLFRKFSSYPYQGRTF